MAIRERSNRAKAYEVYWISPHDGRRQCKSFATLREAQRYESEIKHRKRFAPESFQCDTESGQGESFASLLKLYLKRKQFAPANAKRLLYNIKSLFPFIGHLPPAEITRAVLRDAVIWMEEQHLRQNTIARKIGTVKAILAWAEEQDLLEMNHIRRFRCAQGEDAKTPPPTPTEIKGILAVSPPHLYRVVMLAFYLGVRPGPTELFGMRWSDYDFERRKVVVHSSKVKAKPWREVDLHDELMAQLQDWRADGNELVIHYRGNPVGSVKKAWANALRDAGITRRIRLYDLRHAFATYALEGKADLKAVAEIMGHSDTRMIHKHYQHVLNSQRRAAIDSLPSLKSGLISGHIPGA